MMDTRAQNPIDRPTFDELATTISAHTEKIAECFGPHFVFLYMEVAEAALLVWI